jgi:hypothetical protein
MGGEWIGQGHGALRQGDVLSLDPRTGATNRSVLGILWTCKGDGLPSSWFSSEFEDSSFLKTWGT